MSKNKPDPPSRQGSASLKSTAVPGVRPSSASNKSGKSKSNPEDKKTSVEIQLTPSDVIDRFGLAHIPIDDVLAEMEVRIKRLHATDVKKLRAKSEDLTYLTLCTFYGEQGNEQKLKLMERMAEMDVTGIFTKIFHNYGRIAVTDSIYQVLTVFWNSTHYSKKFCQTLLAGKTHDVIFDVLSSDLYAPNMLQGDPVKVEAAKGLMSVVYNTVRNLDEARGVFRERGIGVFSRFLKSNWEMIRCKAEIVLAYLMTDKQYEETSADDSSIRFILRILKDALASHNHQSARYAFEVDEILMTLNRMAISDVNKEKIVKHGGVKLYVSLLTTESSRDEQYLAAKGLWTLAFKCKEALLAEKGCREALKTLASKTTDEEVRKQANGALWLLEDTGRAQQGQEGGSANSNDDSPHVFLSYEWSHKPTVLRIRDTLKKNGFKVWMDVDSMSGSILEGMARAVEKAAVVVLTLSEKYKESNNCRTEAEYTFRLRKDIVPLRLQHHYQADGWLGALVGNKLFFDFSANNRFDDSIRGLVKELGSRGKLLSQRSMDTVDGEPAIKATKAPPLTAAEPPPSHNNVDTKTNPQSDNSVESWQKSDIKNWLKKNDLGNHTSSFANFDGSMLLELRDMWQCAPEFFFTVLRNDMKLPLESMLRFTKALRTLHR